MGITHLVYYSIDHYATCNINSCSIAYHRRLWDVISNVRFLGGFQPKINWLY